MDVNRLRLLGTYGSNKVMQGELSRLIRRGLSAERSRELREIPPKKCGPGALAYPFSADLAALALCYHRTAARALWDLYEFDVERLEPLYEELMEALLSDPRDWLAGIETISVQAFGTGPILAGERQVVGVVKNALIDAAQRRGQQLTVDPETPQLVIHARPFQLEGEPLKLVISVDLAGKPLHRRGYRLAHGIAPLREDIAAQLLFLARYDAKKEVLIDPLAGSGTIAIEAALSAQAAPLFSGTSASDLSPLLCLKDELPLWGEPLFADTQAIVLAAEYDEETCDAFVANANAAGVGEQVRLLASDFRDWKLDDLIPAGYERMVLSNPPYGARLELSEAELRELYQDLGEFCRRSRVSRACFLVGEPNDAPETRESSVALFLRSFGGRPRIRKPVSNGPLRAQFLLYDFY